MKLLFSIFFLCMVSSCTTINTTESKNKETSKYLIFKDSIRQVLRQNKKTIKNCYKEGLKTNKDLHGKIIIKWSFVEKGIVTKSEVLSNTMNSKEVPLCIANAIKTFTFPDPGDNEVVSKFPFVFGSQNKETESTVKKIFKREE